MKAEITKQGVCSMQVCVPKDWSDDQVTEFANTENPTGIDSQWQIRREGDELLAGQSERVVCSQDSDKVHIMLDC